MLGLCTMIVDETDVLTTTGHEDRCLSIAHRILPIATSLWRPAETLNSEKIAFDQNRDHVPFNFI